MAPWPAAAVLGRIVHIARELPRAIATDAQVPATGRVECARCGRPHGACYCAHLTSIPTRTRVLVLQHPRERGKAIGTARIASLCLPNSEIAVGVDFAGDARVQALTRDPARPAVLLYPGDGVTDVLREPPPGPVTLVVLDGTWHHARALWRRNPWLAALPRYGFAPPRPSEYRIRQEPREDYVSTIEALTLTLGALEGEPQRLQAMLTPFRAMVDTQLGYIARCGTPRKRTRPRVLRAARSRLPLALASPQLLCMTAEANAWPNDRKRGGPPHPHELVQLCAVRLSDGARLERLVAPRLPLAPSPMVHARLSEHALRTGCSVAELRAAWTAFVLPDDVLCTWGHYSTKLVHREQLPLPEAHLDIRTLARDHLNARPGRAEDLVARLQLPHRACGQGRGGERLGMLVAISRWLSAQLGQSCA